MQRVIRDHFQSHTIISVAHKLDTILDYDLVVLLDEGTLLECDTPKRLLADAESAFSRLYNRYRQEAEEVAVARRMGLVKGPGEGEVADAEEGEKVEGKVEGKEEKVDKAEEV